MFGILKTICTVHTRYLASLTVEGSVRMEIKLRSMAQTPGYTLHTL